MFCILSSTSFFPPAIHLFMVINIWFTILQVKLLNSTNHAFWESQSALGALILERTDLMTYFEKNRLKFLYINSSLTILLLIQFWNWTDISLKSVKDETIHVSNPIYLSIFGVFGLIVASPSFIHISIITTSYTQTVLWLAYRRCH